MFTGLLEELVQSLKKMPGIGSKTAQRLAMHLISKDKGGAIHLSETIKNAVENYQNCSICNMLTEIEPCNFCDDKLRDDNMLCIVEESQDVFLIEKTHEYSGKYFILGNLLSPIDGIGPDKINFSKLKNLVKLKNISEIILALNPSAEGESTISFIASQLENVKITRLSIGLPFGGDIEYTSSMTLSNAFKRRFEVDE